MAEPRVHVLQPVEIDENERVLSPEPRRARVLVFQRAGKEAQVVELREVVAHDERAQASILLLEALQPRELASALASKRLPGRERLQDHPNLARHAARLDEAAVCGKRRGDPSRFQHEEDRKPARLAERVQGGQEPSQRRRPLARVHEDEQRLERR